MLPPVTKPARFSQLRCAGPPQIGFVFDYLEDSWEQSYEVLRLVAKNEGKAHVSTLDLDRRELAWWCYTQVRDDSPPHDS